ncbi:MAG: single-stranded DNA-binding protein [Deltaproteobacteria bacterium]|nr:MAG: single-stranded DNA-binding protein [Deltaproteobacteria bacterium]
MTTSTRMLRAARTLARDVAPLRFGPPVSHVYNPLVYAWRAQRAYLRAYAATPKRVVFLGMNPGPFGMAQTGVAFGDVERVRDWLGIEVPVDRPPSEHPRRPVEGFGCARSEVSGTRLWGAIAAHFGSPARFFAHHFVANYCPLLFLEESGRNRTPDKLRTRERQPLFEACDRHLLRVVRILEPEWVIGIGGFAETRARAVLADVDVRVGRVLHPSPANPRANRDWAGAVRRELGALGICTGRPARRR